MKQVKGKAGRSQAQGGLGGPRGEELRELCRFMKAQKVHLFKAGDVIVQFSPDATIPKGFVDPNPPSNETPEEKADREAKDEEETMFWSSSAGA